MSDPLPSLGFTQLGKKTQIPGTYKTGSLSPDAEPTGTGKAPPNKNICSLLESTSRDAEIPHSSGFNKEFFQ